MDLAFDEGQEELGRVARGLFEERCPTTRVRELEEDPLGYDPALWAEMGRLDWLGLTYPEALGGSGAGVTDLAVLYHELGRTLVPGPHLESAVIAGEVLSREADPRAELVAEMVAGDAIVVPALLEADTTYGPDAFVLPATSTPEGWVLDGVKVLVPYAHVARHLLVVARTSAPPDGLTLFLVDPDAPGVQLERLPAISGDPLFAVTFEGVLVGEDRLVGAVGEGWSLLGPALDRATVLRCAQIMGAGERLLELAVGYALERQQFGKPIGQFQAVQYLCTDIAIETHLGSLLLRQAAWRLDQGLPARREVSLAKAHASRAAQSVVHRCHEVFAGVAFMLEADVQLYTRRAKRWEFDLGEARYHDDVVAAGLER